MGRIEAEGQGKVHCTPKAPAIHPLRRSKHKFEESTNHPKLAISHTSSQKESETAGI